MSRCEVIMKENFAMIQKEAVVAYFTSIHNITTGTEFSNIVCTRQIPDLCCQLFLSLFSSTFIICTELKLTGD